MEKRRSTPSFKEQQINWSLHRDAVVTEAERLRQDLERRAVARTQNIEGIEARLRAGLMVLKAGHRVRGLPEKDIISVDTTGNRTVALSGRKRESLQHELNFLRTYESRHPIGEAALAIHTWIRFGMNYKEVMRQRSPRLPRQNPTSSKLPTSEVSS